MVRAQSGAWGAEVGLDWTKVMANMQLRTKHLKRATVHEFCPPQSVCVSG